MDDRSAAGYGIAPEGVATTPLDVARASFRSKTLRRPAVGRLVIRPSIGARAFDVMLAAVGGTVMVGVSGASAAGRRGAGAWWGIALGGFFLVIGVVMLLRDPTWEFDAGAGRMWRRSILGGVRERALAEICGVQVLRGEGGRFESYQLNLVLSGGGRKNLISDAHLRSIWEAAVALGELLGVPVVDCTSGSVGD